MTVKEVMGKNERRAEFVYNAARLAARAAKAPIVPVEWAEREDAFKVQFLDVIGRQCSENRLESPEELHDEWVESYLAMGWIYGEVYDWGKRTHPDLVPYAELGQLERDKDAIFVALCEIARQFIYDSPEELLGSVCRCGKVHTGDYALEEWGRHQCLHEGELSGVDVEKGKVYPERSRRVQVTCPGCGQSWIASIKEEKVV